jgi:hypothetical protein
MSHKPVKSVSVAHAAGEFHVTVTNNLGESIRPFSSADMHEALARASDYADFFGLKLLPFKFAGQTIQPQRSEKFVVEKRAKTVEEYHMLYRGHDNLLNWNKIIHYERENIRTGFRNKTEFRKWLLPHEVMIVFASEHQKTQARKWLGKNCIGSWMNITGGYAFENDRDAVLFKLYHHAPAASL